MLALSLEVTTLALNPRMRGLFDSRRALDLVAADRNQAALELLAAHLERCSYSLYEVRRVLEARAAAEQQRGRAWRSVRIVATGRERDLIRRLRADAAGRPVRSQEHTHRVDLLVRRAELPSVEHALVVAPSGVQAKEQGSGVRG